MLRVETYVDRVPMSYTLLTLNRLNDLDRSETGRRGLFQYAVCVTIPFSGGFNHRQVAEEELMGSVRFFGTNVAPELLNFEAYRRHISWSPF